MGKKGRKDLLIVVVVVWCTIGGVSKDIDRWDSYEVQSAFNKLVPNEVIRGPLSFANNYVSNKSY